MLKEDDIAHLVLQLDDLETDLRNGNIPESTKLLFSLANFLSQKQPLGWLMLANFIIENLEVIEIRLALLHLLPKLKELTMPFQPEQEADPTS